MNQAHVPENLYLAPPVLVGYALVRYAGVGAVLTEQLS
jgi:hypothetical protein